MTTYRDFKKGDVRRYFLVLLTLSDKRTVPATATELEMSKGEVMQVIDHLTTQFGVVLEKAEGDPTWAIKDWGVLNQQAVAKLLGRPASSAKATTRVRAAVTKTPVKKPATAKKPAAKKAAAVKKTPAKKPAAKKA